MLSEQCNCLQRFEGLNVDLVSYGRMMDQFFTALSFLYIYQESYVFTLDPIKRIKHESIHRIGLAKGGVAK